MSNPNALGNQETGSSRPYGIEIQGNDVKITDNILHQFMQPISQRSNGEWYNSLITGNICWDCLGAGQGQASASIWGEDRGDGITAWGAGTVISNNIIRLKDGQDGRIGIHAEGLSPFVVTPGAYDNSLITITGNLVAGAYRRSISFEGVIGATATGNVMQGATWQALSCVVGTKGCTMTGNTVYWDTIYDTWGSWSPKIAPLKLYGDSEGCSIDNNTVYLKSGSKANCAMLFDNTGDGVQVDCSISNNKFVAEDATPEFASAFARIYSFSTNYSVRPRLINNKIKAVAPKGCDINNSIDPVVNSNTFIHASPTAGTHGIDVNSPDMESPIVCENVIDGFETSINVGFIQEGDIRNNKIRNATTGIAFASGVSGVDTTGNKFRNVTTRITGSADSQKPYIEKNQGQLLYLEQQHNLGSIADGSSESVEFTVTGAALGDHVKLATSASFAGLSASSYVSGADTVTVVVSNNTGSAVDRPNFEFRLTVEKYGNLI